VGVEYTGSGSGGEFTYGVTGNARGLGQVVCVGQRIERQNPGCDDERLGDLRLTDCVCVTDGAVFDQIYSRRF
jgi:hypothetical protein